MRPMDASLSRWAVISAFAVTLVTWAVGIAVGCGPQQVKGAALFVPPTDMMQLYGRSASFVTPGRNPVIVIHGVLGSRLEEVGTGQTAWGVLDFGAAPDDDKTRLLALPMADDAPGAPPRPLRDLVDDVQPVRVLDQIRIQLLPGVPLTFNAYAQVLETLGAAGYRSESFSAAGDVNTINHMRSFQFAYDWRRDNVENAQRLGAFIRQRRKDVQQQIQLLWGIPDYPVKFDIVAHSMGGLVTRYYLRYGEQDLPADGSLPEMTWEGAQNVENAVLIGTPSMGLADALLHLVAGAQFAPVLPQASPAALGTMPALYQLMPRSRHLPVVMADSLTTSAGDIYDPATWQRLRWGLADPAQEPQLAKLLPDVPDPADRRRIAAGHLSKCLSRAAQLHRALDLPAIAPEGTRVILFAGDAVPTTKTLAADPETGRVKVHEMGPGDGVVLRSSALGDEREGHMARWTGPRLVSPVRWHSVFFLREDHMGLTSSPDFANNLLYVLLQGPEPRDAAPSPMLESQEAANNDLEFIRRAQQAPGKQPAQP